MLGLAALAACDRRPDTGPVVVSAIVGDEQANVAPLPSRLLTDATAQGLVRFDAAGQVEAGLAERWIVMDQGTSYIFRLRNAVWGDGTPVTAEQVAGALRRRIAARDNPLRPFLTAVAEVVAMTPRVIEVRLTRQRPDLLKLFAQPELAILRRRGGGTGPMRRAGDLLEPAIDPVREEAPVPEAAVRLLGERAALAVARFAARESDLVSGGSFVDRPFLAVARLRRAEIRLDPAVGLFGLAIVGRNGFLAEAANRAAVSQALDRDAIVAAVAPDWEGVDRLLAVPLDSAAPPTVPEWSLLSLEERRTAARTLVTAFAEPVRLRIALPRGPGATALFGQIAASLRSVGIEAARVGSDEPADLRLVDEVAPYDSARWYLANACRPCGAEASAAVDAARDALTIAERGRAIAEADRLVAEDVAFIPLARPMRWSLVARRLGAWQPNARAWHPLNRLRTEPR